jgi:DNA-binding NarL/FixJ family response regulator
LGSEEEGPVIDAILVDDQEVVREGLRSALRGEWRIRVVADYSRPDDAVRHAALRRVDVAIVEYRLEGTSGGELCRQILEQAPGAAVIIHSSYLAEDAVRRCMLAGASAYVAKSAGLKELQTALESILVSGGANRRQALIEQQLQVLQAQQSGKGKPPTPRQREILELGAEGMTNVEIAERLFISESTVRFHFDSLREKFEARSKTELIVKAMRGGFIAPPDETRALVG